jgi:hypothetical protein
MNVPLDHETEKLIESELRSGRFENATAWIGTGSLGINSLGLRSGPCRRLPYSDESLTYIHLHREHFPL